MQDWFTCLSFSHPELFYELPCRFNRQTSVQLLQGDTEAVFEAHHGCEPASEVGVLHSNGALLHRHLRETPRPYLAIAITH